MARGRKEDVVVKQDMSDSEDFFDSLHPRDIVIWVEAILKSLKENPPPQTTELLKKFLRDIQKCDIFILVEAILKILEENPTPQTNELLKKFLRDVQKCDISFLLSNDQHREDSSATCSSEVPFDKNQRRIGEKLVVFLSKEIGQGTDGTVIYEGFYEGRSVAVKRLLQSHIKLADQEIQNLIATDHGQNIVRYHGVEQDIDFVYLALERCDCSLDDLIKIYSAESSDQYELVSDDIHCSTTSVILYKEDRLENLKNILGDVKLYKENNGRPSPLLLKLMRDMVSGLVHLHELRMVHRDLKPQNVLISKGSSSLCAKISDMGISKRLAENKSSLSNHFTGCAAPWWKAPEQLLHGRQTSASDLFSLGCILFYIITRGRHPFGDHERDENIWRKDKPNLFLIENWPEAFYLISPLLKADPKVRPTATEVLRNPFFWDAEKRLSFLHDTSERVINNNALFKAIESTACAALGTTLRGKVLTWDNKVDDRIIKHAKSFLTRDYKFGSVRDLLRLIRNMFNHYRQLPEDIQILVGPLYEGFDDYFTSRFPMLVIEVYIVVRKYCGEEEYFRKYFKGNM